MREVLFEPRKELLGGGQLNAVKGELRHQTRSYKEVLSSTLPNMVGKGDGGRRGSVKGVGHREAPSKPYGALQKFCGMSGGMGGT